MRFSHLVLAVPYGDGPVAGSASAGMLSPYREMRCGDRGDTIVTTRTKAWLWCVGISAAPLGAGIMVALNFPHCPFFDYNGCSGMRADATISMLFRMAMVVFVLGAVLVSIAGRQEAGEGPGDCP